MVIHAIKPKSLASGRELLVDYIERSEREVAIRSGELYSGVWAHPDIEKAVREKVESTNFSIICGPSIDVNDKEIIKQAALGKLKLYRQPDRRGQHYRIFDGGKMFYFEDEHPIFAPSRSGLYIEGNEELGKEFQSEHDMRIRDASLTLITRENYLRDIGYIAPTDGSGPRPPTAEELTRLVEYVSGESLSGTQANEIIESSRRTVDALAPAMKAVMG